MSSDKNEKNCLIGARIKEEREKKDLSQDQLGLSLDTTKRTVGNWERGDSSPDAAQLLSMMSHGMDVLYIVSGQRTPLGVTQGKVPYTPAERAAAQIREMKLSEEDAVMVVSLARRFEIKK